MTVTGCSMPQNPIATVEPSPEPSVAPSSPPTDQPAASPSSSALASMSISADGTSSPSVAPVPRTPSSTGNGSALDHRSPASIHVLVNKQNPLDPADYAPQDLRGPRVQTTKADMVLRDKAASAAEGLFAAAAEDGVSLTLVSAYRSYSYQQGTYNGWVQRYGQSQADRISARPGYSEHQTGLAMDVGAANGACSLEQCFGDTPEGTWVAEHAAEHGWIIRYPSGAEDTTGYSPEPWHLRYVGTREAAGVVQSGGVLETAWGYPAAPGY